MADKQNVSDDEAAVRDLIEAWADAVRRKDYAESSEVMPPIS